MQFLVRPAIVFTLVVLLLACNKTSADIAKANTNLLANPNSTATPAPQDDAPRISLDDAKKAFEAGNAIFVDTRAEVQYKQEHIKGAINIPAESFQTRYAEVPKDKKIIAYCS